VGVGFSNTERVDEVNDLGFRVVLPEPVPLLGTNQALENVTDNVVVELREVERLYLVQEVAPTINSGVVKEGQDIAEITIEYRLIIMRGRLCFVKVLGQLVQDFFARGKRRRDSQLSDSEFPSKSSVEDDLVDQNVATELSCAFEVIANDLFVLG
jgi:hypothetical protein